jgi:hypothetical protein
MVRQVKKSLTGADASMDEKRRYQRSGTGAISVTKTPLGSSLFSPGPQELPFGDNFRGSS